MNAFASEWLKLRTIRAPYGLALGMLAITAIAVVGSIAADVIEADQPARDLVSTASSSSFLALVLGILLVTNEYRHGTITPTFLATPRRERVLIAKVLAGVVAGLAVGLVVAALALAIGVPWLESKGTEIGLGSDLGTAVLRLLATFVLSVAFGIGVGTVIHSQIGAIVATFAWFFVLEGLVALAAGFLVHFDYDPIGPYLPSALFGALSGGEAEVSAAAAAGLLALYTAGLLALGTALTLRRDAD